MTGNDPESDGRSLPLGALSRKIERALDRPFPIEEVRRLTSGASNKMYILTSGTDEVVLRVPPAVKTSPTAHDVVREHRILRALEGTAVPHPRPLLLCEDLSVLGVPFLVIERVEGFHLQLPFEPPVSVEPGLLRALSFAFIDALAALGALNWRSAGLEGFGRPHGFLDRQVDRWLAQLGEYQGRPLPHLDFVTGWLRSNRLAGGPVGVLHGDYQFLNVLFAAELPPRVAAIVDWEQSTIGDPLVDLGWVLGLWSEASERSVVTGNELWVTQLDGMPTRVELLKRYGDISGLEVSNIRYYEVLALFKLACILEGSYTKSLHGSSEHQQHAGFGDLVLRLLEDASAVARGQRS